MIGETGVKSLDARKIHSQVSRRPTASLATIIRERGIFGCGSLHHLITVRQRRRLLEVAYEAGFRQFDVAPAYGNGLAEREVGAFAIELGTDVQIHTKAGIPVTIYPRWADHFFPVARLRDVVFENYRSVFGQRDFSLGTMAQSLADSTTRMYGRVPQGFYLHEPLQPFTEAQWSALVRLLYQLQNDGRFGFWGIAGPQFGSRRLYSGPEPPPAVQCPVAEWLAASPAERAGPRQVSLYGLFGYYAQLRPSAPFEDWLAALAADQPRAQFVLTTHRHDRLAAWGGR